MATVTIDEQNLIGIEVSTHVIQVNTPNKVSITQNGGTDFEPFIFTQASSSDTWTVNHNLGRPVSVTVLTVGGVHMHAGIQQSEPFNQVFISLALPLAGTAIIE